ncbi:sensor histidine kinase [Roseateles chitosanitabidus]|uniref:sensor histidine kinase n=1 Tax=Roseateles chitosanitabidus TaxID=65048 RepID=UPI000B314316|nr:histidine kinase [Roseateles chitosanitabidus]
MTADPKPSLWRDSRRLRASWHAWISAEAMPSGPEWLQWVWTLLFSAGLAVGFTVLGFVMNARKLSDWLNAGSWATWYWRNLVVCVTIGAVIHVMFSILIPLVGGRERILQWPRWGRTMFFSGLPLVGVVIGWVPGMWLAGMAGWVRLDWSQGGRVIGLTALMGLVISFLMHHWFAAKNRELVAERRATETQLRLLQGQIEPHFLFNTLANVHSLIDYDAPKAKAMLGAFTAYLRASLGGLRRESGPLEDELALAEAYLTVLRTRMEDRLRFEIHADAQARRVALPPMLLQPLVENAVHHGLEPKIDGGTVRVDASLREGFLVVEVRDDGVGPGASRRGGNGIALDNIRERLMAQYGDAASLSLEPADPGCLVTLRVPLAS